MTEQELTICTEADLGQQLRDLEYEIFTKFKFEGSVPEEQYKKMVELMEKYKKTDFIPGKIHD